MSKLTTQSCFSATDVANEYAGSTTVAQYILRRLLTTLGEET